MTTADSLSEARRDWKGYARREAAALLDQVGVLSPNVLSRDTLLDLLAAAWMLGLDFGSHATLHEVGTAITSMQDELGGGT